MHECPLKVTVTESKLALEVSLNRLREGEVNEEDAKAFTENFIERIKAGTDFTISCAAECPNNCTLCVESILKLVKNAP